MPYSDIICLEQTHIGWTSSGNAAVFAAIQDPNNNTAIEMRQFFDTDGSGTSGNCHGANNGGDRLTGATQWLLSNNLKGFLGQFSGGSNSVCESSLKGILSYMQRSPSPWIGALWWAAGPGQDNSFSSIEPPNGAAIPQILPNVLMLYYRGLRVVKTSFRL
ncbi:hypothetical protein FRC02_002772 [Tulasnella sp. 418]|nr:hypothetical protein FRC02_002772 [Tulasnella sp. 418]